MTKIDQARDLGIQAANRDWEDHGGNQRDSDGLFLMPSHPSAADIESADVRLGISRECRQAFDQAYHETAVALIAEAKQDA